MLVRDPRAFLAVLCVAVTGGAIALSGVQRPALPRDPRESAERERSERAPARAIATSEPGRVPAAASRASAPDEPGAPAPAPLPADPTRVLYELARRLDDGTTTRVQWESELRATAGSLAIALEEPLAEAAADAARSESTRVAAAELLRLRDEPGAPRALPPAALQLLRAVSASAEPSALRCAAACRALAWFGDAGDRLALVRALADPAGGPLSALAVHGLEGAHAADVAPELVALATDASDDVAERALVTLERMAASAREAWPEASRTDAVQGLAGVLPRLVPGSERELRAIALLGALGGPEAEVALLAELRRASEPATARAAAGLLDPLAMGVRRELSVTLADTALAPGARLAAAEALLRARAWSGAETTAARLHLREVAEGTGDAAARRRAVAALAGFDDPADRDWLAGLARSEEALALHSLVEPASIRR